MPLYTSKVMLGMKTRKSMSDFMESIKDENMVIIPVDIFQNLVSDQIEQRDQLINVQKQMCTTIDSLGNQLAECSRENQKSLHMVAKALEHIAVNTDTENNILPHKNTNIE